MIVGTLAEIWRYPVKSLQGEMLERVKLGPGGLPGDRRAAVLDAETGHVISGKRIEALVTAKASSTPEGPVLTLPGGRSLVPGPDADAVLSDWLGKKVRLATMPSAARPVIDSEGSRTFQGPAGTFLDSSAVHLLTTATLAHLSTLYPEGIFDRRRFRPNLVIDTGAATGPVELDWVGRSIVIGDVSVAVLRPCSRCILTTSAQADLPKDRGILAVVEREQDGIVGVHCRPGAGEIALGDQVTLD